MSCREHAKGNARGGWTIQLPYGAKESHLLSRISLDRGPRTSRLCSDSVTAPPPVLLCGHLQLFLMGLVSGPCDCYTPSCDWRRTPCSALTLSLIAHSSGSFEKNFIGAQPIFNVVLVSAVQQSDSVIHTHIATLFQILLPYRSLQSTE